MTLVQAIENRPEIEVFSFVLQIELPLHRQFWVGDFSFGFFGHGFPDFKIVPAPEHFIGRGEPPQVTAKNIFSTI